MLNQLSLPRHTRLLAVLLGSLGLALAHTPAQAQQEQKFRDWTMLCEQGKDNKKRCILTQTLKAPDGKNEILKTSVGYFGKDGKEPALVITAPLGIALRPGVGIQIDEGQKARIPFERCHTNGCLAGLPMTPELIQALKKGSKLHAEIFLAPGQSRTLDLSLSGFGNGFDAMPKP